ncbi:hypothetical protein CDL12_28677 [Handroanthus impetiginosus]|uniref:Uncharacterized protein n=1 Tax=Handroanthus impetiginosus TaxID=429701 RepID=A0A2G9G1R0_9LAMI|nr:hypothetical protein CDL12_28677 [Handroanthus impetiginosus]
MSIPHFFLFITFALLYYFSGGGAAKTELATQVCRNTTDFVFCRNAIYSDRRAPDADRVVLAYIAFGLAYSNASDTRNYIASRIKSGGGNSGELSRLKNCKIAWSIIIRRFGSWLRCWATWTRRRIPGWINCPLKLRDIHALAKKGSARATRR